MERAKDARVTTRPKETCIQATDNHTDTTPHQTQHNLPGPNVPRAMQNANAANDSCVGQPLAYPSALAHAQQQQPQPFLYPPAPHHASTISHAPHYVHPQLQPFQQQHPAAAMSLAELHAAAAQQLACANSLMAAPNHPSQLQAGLASSSATHPVAAPPAAAAPPPMIVTVPSNVNPGERLLVISPSGARYMVVVPANALPNTRIRVTIPSEEPEMPEAVANPVHFASMLQPGMMMSNMGSMVAAQSYADGHAHLPPGYDVAPNGGQPHKRQKAIKKRAPRPASAYNVFIKDELLRLKAKNLKMPHKEAFVQAAKNWKTYKEAFAQAAKNWKTSDIKNEVGGGTPNQAPAAERGEADARWGEDGVRGDDGDADEGGDTAHSLVVGPDQGEPSDAGDAGVQGVNDSSDPSKLTAATTSEEAGVSASPAAADDGADGAS